MDEMSSSSPSAQSSGFFSLTSLWNWLQENNLILSSDSWLSEYLSPTWQTIFWIIFAIFLLVGTYAFWKRTFQSIKKVIIFINLLLLLYKKGTDLLQVILSNNGGRIIHYPTSQGSNNMMVTLSLQEKILQKLQMVEGKVKDLEDLIMTYKSGKNYTKHPCNCLDCRSPLHTPGFTSTSETMKPG
ncbi:transmembrane and coiled-coil domain-containing protein 2 [Phascolarctos cinereus]|uniref:Transmembrane and coiled-coil domain-containing protein 2 n=1 Tax=Phascolarctos cinereus TaxID=38626 RepID=A0A6P5K2A4_PHACI|nr:transmembrane and coiled-coil domain-containing protein 2 [Phascolarctos cinereus]